MFKKQKKILYNNRIYFLSKCVSRLDNLNLIEKKIQGKIQKYLRLITKVNKRKINVEKTKHIYEISYYNKYHNIEKYEKDERFISKRKYKRQTPSLLLKYNKDSITNESENLILLHKVTRRVNHYASLETLISYFNHLISSGTLEYDHSTKKIYFLCFCNKEERDKANRIVGYKNEICNDKVFVIDLINRLPLLNKPDLLKYHNHIYWIIRRRFYLQKYNLKDCIFCINPKKLQSISYKLDINKIPQTNKKYFNKVNLDLVYRCKTCSRIWCDECKGEYVMKYDLNSHDELSCEDFLKKNKTDVITINSIKCSYCKIIITKDEGCNHIVCTQCKHETCYLCNQNITKEGYNHFKNNNTENKCKLGAEFDHIIN